MNLLTAIRLGGERSTENHKHNLTLWDGLVFGFFGTLGLLNSGLPQRMAQTQYTPPRQSLTLPKDQSLFLPKVREVGISGFAGESFPEGLRYQFTYSVTSDTNESA